MEEKIIIRGARMHNLKNINLEIPHNKLTVITGVSGSGKSSLAFDTIFAEGQRQYVESLSPYMRQFLGQKKAAEVDEIIGLAPSISIDQKALSHNPRSTVGTLTDIYDYLRVLYARLGEVFCPVCGLKIEKLSLEEMIDIIVSRAKETGAGYVTILSPVVLDRKGEYYQLLYDYLNLGYGEARIDGKVHSLREKVELSANKKHSIEIVIDKIMLSDETRLFEAVENSLAYSQGLVIAQSGDKEYLLSSNWTCPNDSFAFPEVEPRLFSFNSPHGACDSCSGLGTIGFEADDICPQCSGTRLRPEALAVRIGGKNIAEVTHLSVAKAYNFFIEYKEKLTSRQLLIAEAVVNQIINRLQFMLRVGLNYLSIDREAETLSGGEAQRIRLSSQIGSQLSRTLYVLDEPTIGLHEKDTDRLIDTLKALRDKNNTVIIVEHDERTILESDYLVDMGPKAGVQGGEIVAIGDTLELLGDNNADNFKESLTLKYLRGKKEIAVPQQKKRRQNHGELKIIGARANNLQNINAAIPLGRLVGITGVSGSGKSSLLYDVIYRNITRIKNQRGRPQLEGVTDIKGTEHINKIVVIDQSPIGRTPRSNPATYTGIFTPIRDFFAELPASKERAYTLSRFSFNRPGGRCEACEGAGANLIEMHFLPPVLVECEVCHGQRFNRETLQVKYKGLNIADVLELTISEALDFFAENYYIADKLKVLVSVGLGYLQLGQSATTLSGGEAQRIKIAKELTHTLGQKTLYLLDEPTTGLHYHDIELLLDVLNKLVDKGNSAFIIEHNMHMIKSMDYVLDLGPEGGDGGGKLMAYGEPEDIVRDDDSVTGVYLKPYLQKK
ncbi:excinuclease ABC subunit A [Candidatus Falkowbacteria bacterium CG_4_10_14_0_2_um_filter_41_15]|uniref:UvrABC system protein A n=2 Tax=Candidatus Falkowiibacteriota TaxID=1752728 RepID=A0A2G9ZMQ5_9BACT|nr:MAG: excinuclease ABC subunit A [Candidatus Falkowbacteria bacterium CG23_combo_of_CG06-09_8_20_14_all_41_10]PJA08813.1 MAG: excinuclease ABC subunit A [Candidatus Falkowbacteria bacterium CG_4_10_14_0_2_um_filter_41_15]